MEFGSQNFCAGSNALLLASGVAQADSRLDQILTSKTLKVFITSD